MEDRVDQQIQTEDHNGRIKQVIKLIKGISSIITFVITLVTFGIAYYQFIYHADIKDFQAKELLYKYGEAYEYALKYKKEHSVSGEESDIDKRKEGMREFEDILSEDLYKEVEEHIFGKYNEYKDIDNYDYIDFVYIYEDENGNSNVEIKNESIVVKKPYIIKKKKDSDKEGFYIQSRTYEVERCGWKHGEFSKYRLKSYVNHMDDLDKDMLGK